ncbi:hypothetical protein [Algoriphagus sp. Y33]|uniref:hypothetical protein n=1 Tax=Algoriphagus sp. Y33 TaxID=2772483 RepID=UPI00177E227A|nr:hypothetical protein [Algoriphagus sp. Y33]
MPSNEIELDIAILLQAFHAFDVCNAGRPKTGDRSRMSDVSTVIARTKDEAIPKAKY